MSARRSRSAAPVGRGTAVAKIAPSLHESLTWVEKFHGQGAYATAMLKDARAELRALLAVARAADRSSISPVDHPGLCRALDRLDKASGRKGEGRP